MKKFTFLVAALCATMMASAAVIQIDDFNSVALAATQANQTVTVQGVTLSFNGTIVDATYEGKTYRTLRVYAGKTLTVSCAEKITKIEVIGMAKKDANVTASAGTVVGGSFSADTYAYENGFDEPLFVINDVNATSTVITPVKQIRLYGIRVTTGEGGGSEGGEEGGEEGGDAIVLDVNYAEATYYEEMGEEGAENFSIDFMYYNAEEDSVHAPYVSFDIYSASATAISGSYSVANTTIGTKYSYVVLTDAELVAEADGFDITDATLTLAYVEQEETEDGDIVYLYDAAANFTADGKKYAIKAQVPLMVYKALDTNEDDVYDFYTDYELIEEATAIRTVEIDNTVYARDGRIYAEEGARIYSLTGLDVTRMNGNLEGIYIVKNGNKVAKVAVAK
ncbi:MAG: hypothetical protein PUE55_02605 [Bacteroidales bacterium]|nr:hypothetical protein [Bacteroidales bacterium]